MGKGNKQHENDMPSADWGSRWEVSDILGLALGPRGFLDTNMREFRILLEYWLYTKSLLQSLAYSLSIAVKGSKINPNIHIHPK